MHPLAVSTMIPISLFVAVFSVTTCATSTDPPLHQIGNEAVKVSLNLTLVRYSVNFISLKMKLTAVLIQEWNDVRLVNRKQNNTDQIWTPAISFLKGPMIGSGDQKILTTRIDSRGNVLRAYDLLLTLDGKQDYHYYPHADSVFKLQLFPEHYTRKEVAFQWKSVQFRDPNGLLKTEIGPDEDLHLITGDRTAKTLIMTAEHPFSDFCNRIYLPSTFFVILSYMTFWVKNPDYRIMLSVSLTINLVIFVSIVAGAFPREGVTTAVDVWTLACLCFTGISLLLIILMNQIPTRSFPVTNVSNNNHSPKEYSEIPAVCRSPKKSTSIFHTKAKLEFCVKLLYPFLFIAFCITYYVMFCVQF